jgi:single-stranded-DNA-specific exonuclease
MNARWIFKDYLYPPETYKDIPELNPLIAKILSARGISPEDAHDFLEPSLGKLHSPFLLSGMEKSVGRILQALRENESVMIHGDYDVDGVTSLALLARNLRRLGLPHIKPYIPDRFDEGYGLSEKGIREAKSNGISLIITVDCGTTALREVEMARELGIDIIVTDHHEPKDQLPITTIINPKIGNYPDKNLAGVGVAFKLLEALYETLKIDKKVLFWDLDLVALGTVADLVPLTGENRILVKHGLKIIDNTLKVGIKALKKVSRYDGETTPWHISFLLAPRLNAAGRLSHAEKSFRLLVTTDGKEALEIAEELDRENRRRQDIEREILEQAKSMVNGLDLDENWVLVLGNPDWHEGVIGIVASKLVEIYNRPAVLVSLGEIEGKGSARSIPSFHLYNALKANESLFITFGGHKYAAGFRIPVGKLDSLRVALNKIAKEEMTPDDLIPEISIDAKVSFEDFEGDFFEQYSMLSPFGFGNPVPLFLLENAEVVGQIKRIGESLKFTLRQNKKHFSSIAYEMGSFENALTRGQSVDAVFQLSEDHWCVRPNWILKIVDMRMR